MKNNIVLGLLLLAVQTVLANEPVLRIESTITGNQEQPKILSIVPWQTIPEAKYIGEDIEFEVGYENLEFIDRESFKLEVQYIRAIQEK